LSFKVYIPARYASQRLPGKALLDIAGKPLLQHVWERAVGSAAETVVIATDDERIAAAARGFGAEAVMTSPALASGSDRIAVAAELRGEAADTVIVNLQGDEPEVSGAVIDQVAGLLDDPARQMATLYEPITRLEELLDPNVVKVVTDGAGRALYFSRAPLPWDRLAAEDRTNSLALAKRHLGIYAYRGGCLQQFTRLPPAPLERVEALEQLRALENGIAIYTAEACSPCGIGIDTEADLERVRQRLER
jgi:3-deoxy-manno-octulosonate cytidylyltransferase (CMP-KDO synthetase)